YCSCLLYLGTRSGGQRGPHGRGKKLVGGMAVKPLLERPHLIGSAFGGVNASHQGLCAGYRAEIPAYMFARRPDACVLAIEPVMVMQMLQQAFAQFAITGRRQMFARGQKVGDLTKYPGASLSGAA